MRLSGKQWFKGHSRYEGKQLPAAGLLPPGTEGTEEGKAESDRGFTRITRIKTKAIATADFAEDAIGFGNSVLRSHQRRFLIISGHEHETMKHRIVHFVQKYLLNPPIKLLFAMGVVLPGYALLETTGRKT